MATVVTYKPARVQEIVDGTVTDGTVNGSDRLILEQRNGLTIDAGPVRGPQGFQGPERPHKAGHISLYAGAQAPMGWLLCDGSVISRANFPELFAEIGTTYGTGDGVTTFHIPDLRGRVPVGLDPTQTEFDVLGERGGEKAHILTEAELPSHTHGIIGYKGKDDENFTGNLGRLQASDFTTPYDKPTSATGSNAAHNNLQPYQTLNYIISIGSAAPQGGGIAAARYNTTTDIGTTAQRNAKYGSPGTSAARVALHNQRVTWFNTDLGWEERYYALSTESGLTGVGILIGGTAGWYPIHKGPYVELIALAEVNNFIDTFITGWSMHNRKGGASWFTMTGTDRVNVLQHGRYDVTVFTTQYGGNTASPDYSLQILATDNATLVRGVGGGAFTKMTSYMTRPHMELYDTIIQANQKVAFKLQRGTVPGTDTNMPVHTGGPDVDRGRFRIEYVGPPVADIET